ncbi:cell division initiation protein [Microbacterium sp. SLBN-111]|uniref:cell division initiation protein n=1 Tax=Microbacterium sp. SLBN-111 TaxID=3377733 RepID=UPI003C732BFD
MTDDQPGSDRGSVSPGDEAVPDSPLDELLRRDDDGDLPSFPVGFRGYDREAVDDAVRVLRDRVRTAEDSAHREKLRAEAMFAQQRADHDAELAESVRHHTEETGRLQEQVRAASARAAEAEAQVSALSSDLVSDADGERSDPAQARQQFEAILRVAEEQAGVLVQNAAAQAERLLAAARDEAGQIRDDAVAERERIRTEAHHDAEQVRLRVETEAAAHAARLEREGAHAAEKVAQAEREAVAVRTEAEKGAAALRSLVSRETTDLRAKAETDVREMTARVLEFEESLTRRQDDAQQEFLVLHNQAVAHAERITADATEQVESALEHARRIGARADDHERLARAQAQQVVTHAQVQAREILDDAREKAQRIADAITGHASTVLRNAEDRTRDLRWQQQQLGSFLAEMNELLRAAPRGTSAGADDRSDTNSDDETTPPE